MPKNVVLTLINNVEQVTYEDFQNLQKIVETPTSVNK